MTFRTRLISTALLVYAGVAGWGVVGEVLALTSTEADAVENGSGDYPALSASLTEQRLDQCERTLFGLRASVQSNQLRTTYAKHCQEFAQRAIVDSPTNGRAHFLLAVAAQQLDDLDGFLRHMQLSQLYAGYEGWLSQRRFVVLSQDTAPGSADLLADEIAILLTMQSGAERLAQSFAQDATLRPPIRAALATAEQQIQQRFLNLLRGQDTGA